MAGEYIKRGALKILLSGFSGFAAIFIFIIAAIPMLFLNVSLATHNPNHWIGGIHEFYNDSDVYFDIYPKTTKGEPVYINATSKAFTGAVDVVIGVNTSDMDILGAELYNRKNNSVTRTARCHAPFWYNYTLSPKHVWCWQNTTLYDELNNSVGTNYSLAWERDFETYDLAKNEVYWTEYAITEWDNVAGLFDKTEYKYQGFNTWYYASGLNVEAGKSYLLRFFPRILPNKTGKYFFGIKPSSETFAQAVSLGHFYNVDPDYNTTTLFKRRFSINVTGNSNTVTNLTLSINGTSGLTVGGSARINMMCLFPLINGTYYLYYNDETDVQVTNEAEDLRLACKGEILGHNYTPSSAFSSYTKDATFMRKSGNAVVSEATGRTCSAVAGTPQQVEQHPGLTGFSVNQTNTDKAFRCSDTGDYNVTGSNFYARAVVRYTNVTAHGNGMSMINKWTANDNYWIRPEGNTAIATIVRISGTSLAISAIGIPNNNELYDIVLAYDGITSRLYINSVLNGTPASFATARAMPSTTGVACIGMDVLDGSACNTANYFAGYIDYIEVGEKNLSQNEITVLYECIRGAEQGTCWDFGAEQSTNTNEAQGRTSIEQGIQDSLGAGAAIYTDQQIYTRNITGGQQLAKFDKFTLNGTKRWAFNYVTAGENFTNMRNMTPSFYVLEMANLSISAIRTRVSEFINQTK